MLNFVILYSPVNHRIRHAVYRVEIISIISLNIEIKKIKRGVNNPIPGACSLVQKVNCRIYATIGNVPISAIPSVILELTAQATEKLDGLDSPIAVRAADRQNSSSYGPRRKRYHIVYYYTIHPPSARVCALHPRGIRRNK
jgi:hypothetical protein